MTQDQVSDIFQEWIDAKIHVNWSKEMVVEIYNEGLIEW
jgi:hypothetical protein